MLQVWSYLKTFNIDVTTLIQWYLQTWCGYETKISLELSLEVVYIDCFVDACGLDSKLFCLQIKFSM